MEIQLSELFKIHFGFSHKSKYYPQAVELAKLAYKHEIQGEHEDIWHIATLNSGQIDLMVSLYNLALKLPTPKIYGADVHYTIAYCRSNKQYAYNYASEASTQRVHDAVERLQKETGKHPNRLADYLTTKFIFRIESDMQKVYEKLQSSGYIDYVDQVTHTFVKASNVPQEPISKYRQIRHLIKEGNFEAAIQNYYTTLGGKYYGELTSELIYLKRIANIPLLGRDLLYFKNQSSKSDLVNANIAKYVACIDSVLVEYKKDGRNLPLDIIIEYAPTMEQLIEKTRAEIHSYVDLCDGGFKRDLSPITADFFGPTYCFCNKGRFLNKYPDQVQHCRVEESVEDSSYAGFWTTYSPERHQEDILDKGLRVGGIEAYRHIRWRRSRREPDFPSLMSKDEIKKNEYGTSGIRYTGRRHSINGKLFYEIDLIRYKEKPVVTMNPLIELIDGILREAENTLRVNEGLPRIGEGWISETQLYNLIKETFPDSKQHATPDWLKPQHLDIYVHSKKLAFEYQGQQHFEPIDFFGGLKSFEETVRRDKRKRLKCKRNDVLLIYWKYDEAINNEVLKNKLENFNHNNAE
jgi:hypothetical protein